MSAFCWPRAAHRKPISSGSGEKLLNQFLDLLDARSASTITTELALAWACESRAGGPNWWAHRLSIVRGFASYVHAGDATAVVPPRDLLPCGPRRATPYLYVDADVVALINAANGLRTPIRRATYRTLVGLLAVTGMRIGEAIGLDRHDFDARAGVQVDVWKLEVERLAESQARDAQ